MVSIRRISILLMLTLFLGLSFGVEIYSVQCHMRNEKFISLSSGMDPCLTADAHHDEESHSCCASKKDCLSEENEDENHGCCDEEEIVISYEPDAFSYAKIFLPILTFAPNLQFFADFQEFFASEKPWLSEFPQPPPLQGRQILNLHCVLRI